jgi:bacillithiol biosynthesis cysteine-adding enzyme BshC
LKEEFPKENFIPVYWMATEDHDFEEINHFFLEDKKIVWDVESSGPVGRRSTEGIDLVFEAFSKNIGTNKNTEYLQKLFEEAYLKHGTLTEATRYLVNELFGKYGLVIIDGDEADLKRQFIPFIKKELVEKFSHQSIRYTNLFLEENYKVQVNPREVNLFYFGNNLRERIVIEENSFRINNTVKLFSQEELLTELDNHPEKFSPNVILRPLYQEVILPNLCYVGGGGELAYWLQLKELFAAAKISFPILLLRNSVLLSTRKLAKKINNLELEYQDLFLKQEQLCNRVVENSSKIELNFDAKRQKIQEIFEELKPLVTQTDITFKGALEAQEKKQLKGIQNLEKRLLKAEKRKHKDVLDRTKRLQNSLFPRYGLQERNMNFSVFYAEFGQELIPRLIKELEPLESEFSIIEM